MSEPRFLLPLRPLDAGELDSLLSVTSDPGNTTTDGQSPLMREASKREPRKMVMSKEDEFGNSRWFTAHLLKVHPLIPFTCPSFSSAQGHHHQVPMQPQEKKKRAEAPAVVCLCEKNLIISHSSAFSLLIRLRSMEYTTRITKYKGLSFSTNPSYFPPVASFCRLGLR